MSDYDPDRAAKPDGEVARGAADGGAATAAAPHSSAASAAQTAATQAMMAFMGGAALLASPDALSPVGSDLDALKSKTE